MSQQNPNSFPIDPYTTTGIELASKLNELNDANNTTNSGTSRPSYAVQGYHWVDVSESINRIKFYTGTVDLSNIEYDTVKNKARINGGDTFTDTGRAIISKSSVTALETPTPADMEGGELLINRADKKLYFLDDTGALAEIGAAVATAPLPTAGQLGNRNVVINGDGIIAQEFDSVTTVVPVGTSVYVMDQWEFYAEGSDVSVTPTASNSLAGSRSGMKMAGGAGNTLVRAVQNIEADNVAHLAGKEGVISFKIFCNPTSLNCRVRIFEYNSRNNPNLNTELFTNSFTITNGWNTIELPIGSYTDLVHNGLSIVIEGFNLVSEFVEFTNVQLEEGISATDFEVKDIGSVLLDCQRYLNVILNSSLFNGYNSSTTRLTASVAHPVTMFKIPTLTYIANTNTYATDAGGNHLVTSVAISGLNSTQNSPLLANTTGLVAGQAGQLTIRQDRVALFRAQM